MKKLFLTIAVVAVSVACSAQGVGEKYKDISGLNSPEGKEVKLSKVVKENKYTLLDFWASWCAPCMAEVPYMTEAYKNYKGKGFEIYGVSYDQDGDAWKDAIKDKGLNWVHVSALKGWKCPTSDQYGVKSIPRNLLIDREGNIVAENLRGEALERKLAELLD